MTLTVLSREMKNCEVSFESAIKGQIRVWGKKPLYGTYVICFHSQLKPTKVRLKQSFESGICQIYVHVYSYTRVCVYLCL